MTDNNPVLAAQRTHAGGAGRRRVTVVVGCDGHPDGDGTLRFAAEESQLRHARLVLVTTYAGRSTRTWTTSTSRTRGCAAGPPPPRRSRCAGR